MIPIAAAVGDNDFGKNAFATMSEAKIDDINFYTFLHANDIRQNKNVFRKLFNITGYGVEVYSLNSGYYGYFQKQEMLQWFMNNGKIDPSAFKVAFYHNPVFSGCPDHKPTFEELDAKVKLRTLFNTLNVKVAFEHHENLYKVSYFMRDKAIVEDSEEKGTLYLGGGRWGAPATTCTIADEEIPYYLRKLTKDQHVWVMNIKYEQGKVKKEIQSIDVNGKVLDTFIF